jgi:putative tricarboxylic transport membrane protein
VDLIGFDISAVFALDVVIAITIGALIGLVVGALPGLGAVVALVLILPFTYVLDPLVAILLLLAAYQAAEYGGSISSIMIGIPGTAAAVATREDGFPMAKQGLPGKAMGISLAASTVGGLAGGLALLFVSKPITEVVLQFSSAEFFLIAIMGLLALTTITSKSKIKMWISIVVGLMVSTIGIDMATGITRYTGGAPELSAGLPLVVAMIGLFAFPELFRMVENKFKPGDLDQKGSLNAWLPFKEMREIGKSTAVGSAIGAFIGVIPGMGAGGASWFAYGASRKLSKKPELFGKGSPEGIAGPEAANNAVVGTSMVPLLTLGVPGSASNAVIMGAFIIQGIEPGPTLFENNTDLVYGILVGFLLTTIATYLLGLTLTPAFSRALKVPAHILVPVVLLLSILGVYAASALMLEVWMALAIGMIVFVLSRFDFSTSGFVLAYVLGGVIEENLRRTLQLSDGSLLVFVTRPWACAFVIIMALMLAWMVYSSIRGRRKSPALSGVSAPQSASEAPAQPSNDALSPCGQGASGKDADSRKGSS